MKEETFKIEGMMCQGCVKTVENGLKATKGVKSVCADLSTSTVTITYDEQSTSTSALYSVVEGLGYKLLIP